MAAEKNAKYRSEIQMVSPYLGEVDYARCWGSTRLPIHMARVHPELFSVGGRIGGDNGHETEVALGQRLMLSLYR